MLVYMSLNAFSIEQMEELKWSMLLDNKLESALYAIYLQHRIDELLAHQNNFEFTLDEND